MIKISRKKTCALSNVVSESTANPDRKTVVTPIGVERAMRAIVIHTVYVLGKENRPSSLELGGFSNCAILNKDPFDMELKNRNINNF